MIRRLMFVWNQQTHLTESSLFLKEYIEFVFLSAL